MHLRIQQGRLRGRRIPVPPEIKRQAHFTPALIKEAALQIFENRCLPEETAFFDLCAGSGQMGFEALSRGFRTAVLVEIDSGRIGLLRETARSLGLGDEGQGAASPDAGEASSELIIQRKDFRRMPAQILREKRAAIFIDPPYSFWKRDDCPPVREFLENLARLRAERGSDANDGGQGGEFLFLLQGPAPLEPLSGRGLPAPEIRRHGRHYLTIIHLLPAGENGAESAPERKPNGNLSPRP